MRKTQFETKELYLLVLSVAAACNRIPSLGRYVVKAYFFPTIGTVFIYMTCNVLCYDQISPAHCCFALWEDSWIGREVFKHTLQYNRTLDKRPPPTHPRRCSRTLSALRPVQPRRPAQPRHCLLLGFFLCLGESLMHAVQTTTEALGFIYLLFFCF